MEISDKKGIIKRNSGRSPLIKDILLAFLVGGAVCVLGQLLFFLYNYMGADEKTAWMLVTVSIIFIAATLTALGVFDDIARRAGAGTLVPVSGFSNAVVSEAMDSSYEGYILGVGAKIFTVAGPVILFGILSGVLYGLVYYLYGLISSYM